MTRPIRKKTAAAIAEGKEFLEKGLMALGIDYIPSTANYYLIRLDQALQIIVSLRKKGILVRDCSNFAGLDGSSIRIAVRSPPGERSIAEGACKVMRAIVIAGTHSGCGKTTVTLGILAALRKKGLTVQPFKNRA